MSLGFFIATISANADPRILNKLHLNEYETSRREFPGNKWFSQIIERLSVIGFLLNHENGLKSRQALRQRETNVPG